MAKVDRRYAERLTSRGWTVHAPVDRTGCPNDLPGVLCCSEVGHCVIMNPCARGCSNPDVHAEGGHDV